MNQNYFSSALNVISFNSLVGWFVLNDPLNFCCIWNCIEPIFSYQSLELSGHYGDVMSPNIWLVYSMYCMFCFSTHHDGVWLLSAAKLIRAGIQLLHLSQISTETSFPLAWKIWKLAECHSWSWNTYCDISQSKSGQTHKIKVQKQVSSQLLVLIWF